MGVVFLILACTSDPILTGDSATTELLGGDDSKPGDPDPQPPGDTLVINEILAGNTSSNSDEAGEDDDWVEIYNPSDSRVALTGLYLTDDEDTPNRWALPGNIGIEARDFLLIWCDGQPEQGATHAPFKLKQTGEFVGIFRMDGGAAEMLDGVRYSNQSDDVAFARVPDGSSTWEEQDPTPEASNQ